MKKKIIITFGVLVVLLGALIVAPNLIDWNSYKPQVASVVKDTTGQTVNLDGDLSFKLLPSPALRVSDISLANWPGGKAENFLEMEGLDIRLELFPLLSGDFKITSLVVDGGKIYLEVDEQGRANWETLFAGEEAETADAEDSNEVAINSFILRSTDIYYSDRSTGTEESVTDIDADLIVTSLAGPFNGSGELAYMGQPVEFSFATGLFSEGANVPLRFGVVPGGRGDGLNFQGTFVQESNVTALSGSLTGSGPSLVPLMAFAGQSESMEDGPFDTNYKLSSDLLLVLTSEKTDMVLDSLDLTLGKARGQGKIQVLMADQLETKVNLSMDNMDFDAFLPKTDPDAPEEAFELPIDIKADLDLSVRRATYLKAAIENIALKGVLEGGRLTISNMEAVLPGNSDLKLTGVLSARAGRPNLAAKVHLDARSFRPLADWYDIDLSEFPSNRVTRVTFDGEVQLAGPKLELTRTTLTVDSTRFAGGMSLDMDNPNLFAVNGTINTIDLDSYFPALLEESEETDLATTINNLQESLTAFTGYDGRVALKAGRVKMMAANLQDITLNLNLKGNDMEVGTLQVGSFEGTRIAGSGSVRDIPGRFVYDLKTTLASNSFKPLMVWAKTESPFEERVVPEGTLNVTLSGNKTQTSFDLNGVLSGITFGLDGQAENLMGTPVLTANLALRHERMIEFVRKFSPEYFPAKTPLGQVDVKASLKGDAEDLRIENINALLGPSRFQGNLRMQTRNERPYYTGGITAGSVRLDDYMARSEAGLVEASEGGNRWSSEPLDTAFIKDNDFNITFRADSVAYQTYTFNKPNVRLKAEGGILTIEGLTAGFYGGRIAINGALDARQTPALNLKMDMTDVSVLEALKASSGIDRLTGAMNFSGEFNSRGTSQKALIEGLTGKASFAATDGIMRGINLSKLAQNLKSLNSIEGIFTFVSNPLGGGQSAYRYIRTNLEIKNGVANFGSLDTDVDHAQIGGRGTINLAQWALNASGAIRLNDFPNLPAIGVNMAGPIDNAKVSFDFDSLIAKKREELSTNIFENLLGSQQKKPAAEGEGAEVEEPAPAEAEEEETTPEEEMLKGLFDLLGGEEEEEEEDDEGGSN